MNCKSVQNRLSAYLDRELGGDELLQMRAHMSTCRDCRAEVEGLRSLKSLLGGIQCPEPPADLAERLTQNIRRRSFEEPKRSFRMSAFMFAGVTACSMAATFLVYGIARHSSTPNSPNVGSSANVLTIDDDILGSNAPVISAANFGPR